MEGFPPICDARTEVMFFGSFPSVKSLEKQQYYSHPQNQFWRLLGELIDENLYSLPYNKRIPIILRHKVGIWDSFRACEREGSLDSNIKKPEINDFSTLKKLVPKLRLVCFTGKTAAKAQKALEDLGYATVVLPSPSPANTIGVEKKLEEWERLIWPSLDRTATMR